MLNPISRINKCNLNTELEETLEVGIEALRLPMKTDTRELNNIEKAKGIGKKFQVNPCADSNCQNKCKNKFSEKYRHEIFSEFWGSGDPMSQKDYLLSSARTIDIKRKRV